MQADCARCQHLESEREDITEALLALRKKIHADVTIRSHPERVVATLNQGLRDIETRRPICRKAHSTACG